jgi:hypothetical protein
MYLYEDVRLSLFTRAGGTPVLIRDAPQTLTSPQSGVEQGARRLPDCGA